MGLKEVIVWCRPSHLGDNVMHRHHVAAESLRPSVYQYLREGFDNGGGDLIAVGVDDYLLDKRRPQQGVRDPMEKWSACYFARFFRGTRSE